MSELKAPVKELSQKIQAAAKLEGTVYGQPKDLFSATLPEGLTMDTVKAVDAHRTNFTAAYLDAFGAVAAPAMLADKSMEKITGKVELNKDILQVALLREETRPDPQNPGKTVTRHGVTKVNYKANAGKADTGQVAIVRTSIRSMFAGLAD